MMRRVFFCLLVLFAATGSAFADDTLPQPRSGAANVAESHVKVLGALFARAGNTDYACVAFTNQYTAPLTSATFKLFFMGQPKSDLDIAVKATEAPNLPVLPPMQNHPGDPTTMPNCAPFQGDRSKVQMIFVFPNRFEFSDGTSWELKKKGESPSPSPSTSPSPSATP